MDQLGETHEDRLIMVASCPAGGDGWRGRFTHAVAATLLGVSACRRSSTAGHSEARHTAGTAPSVRDAGRRPPQAELARAWDGSNLPWAAEAPVPLTSNGPL